MYDPRPEKAADYRRQAENIRTMARQISLSESRNRLLNAARDLDGLAEEEERKAQQVASQSEPEPEA